MASYKKLVNAVEVVETKCINRQPGENVLIVADTLQSKKICDVLLEVRSSAEMDTELIVMQPRRYPGEEPPKPVAEALRSADIVISVPITYSEAVQTARKSGARFLVATGVTEDLRGDP